MQRVPARERVPYWHAWVNRQFGGLDSDLYDDQVFDGEMRSIQAGEVHLTRLEANRHRFRAARRRPGRVGAAATAAR